MLKLALDWYDKEKNLRLQREEEELRREHEGMKAIIKKDLPEIFWGRIKTRGAVLYLDLELQEEIILSTFKDCKPILPKYIYDEKSFFSFYSLMNYISNHLEEEDDDGI